MEFRKCLAPALLIGFSCTTAIALADEPTEKVFYNAGIFTGDPGHPYAEAVATRGDKIVAVGSPGDVAKAVGAKAESVDLHGKWLLPGLIDSHSHSIWADSR